MSDKTKELLTEVFNAIQIAIAGRERGKMVNATHILDEIIRVHEKMTREELLELINELINLKLVWYYDATNKTRYYAPTKLGLKRWAERQRNSQQMK